VASPDPEIGIVGSMGPSGNDDRSGDRQLT